MLTRAVALLLFATAASAASDPLTDADLVAQANAVMSAKEPPVDRILGTHKGVPVIVDDRCSGACPQDTVRVIHYTIDPGPACTKLGADTANVMVPMGLVNRPQSFCVPHTLYSRRLYFGGPYRQ
jgi:hypothetical protein